MMQKKRIKDEKKKKRQKIQDRMTGQHKRRLISEWMGGAAANEDIGQNGTRQVSEG
jgi:hypothetical protein